MMLVTALAYGAASNTPDLAFADPVEDVPTDDGSTTDDVELAKSGH